jgi:hypothetical protein
MPHNLSALAVESVTAALHGGANQRGTKKRGPGENRPARVTSKTDAKNYWQTGSP